MQLPMSLAIFFDMVAGWRVISTPRRSKIAESSGLLGRLDGQPGSKPCVMWADKAIEIIHATLQGIS